MKTAEFYFRRPLWCRPASAEFAIQLIAKRLDRQADSAQISRTDIIGFMEDKLRFDQSGMPASGARHCPSCGRDFICGMDAGQGRCWCADLPPVKIPEPAPGGCYCPDCLRKLLENSSCSP